MSDHVLQALKQSADLALKSSTVQEGLSHLTQAFSLFLEETNKLKKAHLKLQEELETVNKELSKRKNEINFLSSRFDSVLKVISEGILFIKLDGTIALMNDAALKMLKIKESILKTSFWSVFEDAFFGFSMKEALQFGISYKQIYRINLEITTQFIYEGKKEDFGILLKIKDLKEKKTLLEKINQNEAMKELGQVAAAVAHEIRNPLGGIRGYATLLSKDLTGNENLQEMAYFILDATKALEKVVSRILFYARPIDIEVETADLGSFLKKVGKFVRVDPAVAKNIRFSLHIPDAPVLAPFDEKALKGALLNLIFNAIQAMPDGGELTLSLLKLESTCQISVADTGIGIEEKDLDLLFSPFYTTKKGGNGLGLVETAKVVKGHFGFIDYRSKVGKGTTFTLTLPLKR